MKTKFVIFVVALLMLSSVCSAYSTVLPAANVNDISVQPLPGYVLQGQAPSDLTVLVNIAIPLKNVDLLGSMVKQVSDPSSPLFRHFLTPEQIEQEFLPKNAYASMFSYLQDVGFHVVSASLDSIIVAQGTVAQVNEYLHANVNIYTNGTSTYYMTSTNSLFNGAHFVASNATALTVKPQIANLFAAQPNENTTFTQGGFSAKKLQTIYNATSLYSEGFQGENQTIGMLDFFGSPTIRQDLTLFDKQFNFPDPNFTITPIGPYNPNLGVAAGWSSEVALDVETSHAMAPKAAIDMYVATGAFSFAADLAPIISQNKVTTLSMSFSFAPEWLYSLVGGELFYFNMLLPDQYFMLGSLQGITFLCSSGDVGGSGDSSGPAGNLAYPSDSPYVTSTGGTQTYFFTQPNGSMIFNQTGWSNPGYVPNGVNVGGSGGGVSFLEPKPWYQQSQPTPPSYPNGRMVPDLALQAGTDPGTYFVDAGSTMISGGTSESAQVLSGLITLIAQSSGGPIGLINPFLYSLGYNDSLYDKAFTPITFGYNIPWEASLGYNLVTGWGAPNIGELAYFYNVSVVPSSLSVSVMLTDSSGNSPIEFTPEQTIYVTASVYNGSKPTTNGNFTASLDTLAGTSLVTPMTYNSTSEAWVCTLTMGQQSGIAYVNVNGTSGNLLGEGSTEIFAGYLATFYSPTPTDPWTTAPNGLQVIVASTDLNGNSAPENSLTLQVNSYSILRNSFNTVDQVSLIGAQISGLVNATAANLTSPYHSGPLTLMLQGNTYGFLPFMNGIYLQTSLVYPEVIAEPGSIAPGQYLTIITSPVSPVNIADIPSFDSGETIGSDISSGANVTALLVSASGNIITRSDLTNQGSKLAGLLQVPTNATSGLYTILLDASYGSSTLELILTGSFYSQIWVSTGTIVPLITVSPSTLYMGQRAKISVALRYPNGQPVTQGEYTVVIYPEELQDQLSSIMYSEYLNSELTPLSYDATLNIWVANVTLPSPYNAGVTSIVNGNTLYYAGPYDAYVTGISCDGLPTTTALSAQSSFFIQPYVYITNQLISTLQQDWGLALNKVTLTGSANLSNDVFLGSNYLQSKTALISNSIINGTLFVTGSDLTLQGVHGGNLVATNSSVTLKNSDLDSVTLDNSVLSVSSSSYQIIVPSPPSIQILAPSNGGNYTGDLKANIIVTGNNIKSVMVYLNAQSIQTFSKNGTLSFALSTANYPDGAYSMKIVATQDDGVSSSANLTMYFQNQANLALLDIVSLNSTQSTMQNQLNNLGQNLTSLNSSQSTLQNQLGNLGNNLNSSLDALHNQISNLKDSLTDVEYLAFAGIGIGAIGIVLAVVVVLRKNRKGSSPPPLP